MVKVVLYMRWRSGEGSGFVVGSPAVYLHYLPTVITYYK